MSFLTQSDFGVLLLLVLLCRACPAVRQIRAGPTLYGALVMGLSSVL